MILDPWHIQPQLKKLTKHFMHYLEVMEVIQGEEEEEVQERKSALFGIISMTMFNLLCLFTLKLRLALSQPLLEEDQ
jgi:hypothetical protein